MAPFRKEDREFAERLFKNAQRQSAGSLGSEQLKEFLVDPKTGELLPVKFENTSLQIDQQGIPVVSTERINIMGACGHRICSLEQVLGKCKNGHLICTLCKGRFFTCEICGQKLCDLDVILVDDEIPVCPEHDRDIMKANLKAGVLRAAGNTLKYLAGWSGDREPNDE